jgi:hypothetical protein
MAPRLRAFWCCLFALLGAAASACGSGGGTGAPPSAPSCADYCAAIGAACTTSNQQYSNLDDCMNSCQAFPLGTAADTTGDTLGCRSAYARKAAMSADLAAMHCTHAGPGGDGVCGDNCGGFCDIAMMYCTEVNNAKIYDTREACMADCATHLTDVKLNAGDGARTDMGNEVACMLYHVQMGSAAPNSHCLGDLAFGAGTCR